jgi:hypothetical protein
VTLWGGGGGVLLCNHGVLFSGHDMNSKQEGSCSRGRGTDSSEEETGVGACCFDRAMEAYRRWDNLRALCHCADGLPGQGPRALGTLVAGRAGRGGKSSEAGRGSCEVSGRGPQKMNTLRKGLAGALWPGPSTPQWVAFVSDTVSSLAVVHGGWGGAWRGHSAAQPMSWGGSGGWKLGVGSGLSLPWQEGQCWLRGCCFTVASQMRHQPGALAGWVGAGGRRLELARQAPPTPPGGPARSLGAGGAQ